MRLRWILIFLLVLVIAIIYINYQNQDVTYVKSDIDSEYYLVRDLDDKQQASNMLAKIKGNIMYLTNYLYKYRDSKYTEYQQYIVQLHSRIKNVVVLESSEDSVYTSYSVNKGEQIVFCLRSRKIKNQLHKLNLLMYVVLHEISHVACPEYGHTPLFKRIFAFITEVAILIGLYNKIDFSHDPMEYCGLIITDSIV
jgi:hypothetical protein